MKLERTYALDVCAKEAKHWVIIGAGGTGGYYIPNMMRQISIQNRALSLLGRPQHKVTIVDADNVEHSNLTRQNFVQNDVGKNKAEVMAARYGKAFGMELSYIPEYIQSAEQLASIAKVGKMKPVFVGCVDNNKTRVLIYETYKNIPEAFWIDGGNEEWGGQAVCGFNFSGVLPDSTVKGPQKFHLPSVVEVYPEVLQAQDKLPTELSCGERAVSAPQNIYTNMTAANVLMGYTNTILTAKAEEGEGLKYFSVAFNAQTFASTTLLNTMENLKPVPAPAPVAEEVKAEEEIEVVVVKKAKTKKKEVKETVEAEA